MIFRAELIITTLDPTLYPKAMELITQALNSTKNPSKKTLIKELLTELAANNYLDAEYFLFINLYRPDGYFLQDKQEAFALFKKHPGAHLSSYCASEVQEMQKERFTELELEIQTQCFNELLNIIPEELTTPMVGVACNRFLAYAALFVMRDFTAAYEHFALMPKDFLSISDLYQLSSMIWLQANTEPMIAHNLALSLVNSAIEKEPNNEQLSELKCILQNTILQKPGVWNTNKLSPQDNIQVSAIRTPVNKVQQQITLLEKYQNYLQLQSEFEPKTASNRFALWTPVKQEPLLKQIIKGLNEGSDLDSLLSDKQITNACRQHPAFKNLMGQLKDVSWLPESTFSLSQG